MKKAEKKNGDITRLKWLFFFHFMECALILVVLCFAVITRFSRAWFANNRQVSGADSMVTSATTTSLFVEKGTVLPAQKNYYTIVSHLWQNEGALYPISTKDCTNWWYASSFDTVIDGSGNASLVADGFTRATVGNSISTTTIVESNYAGSYLNSFENNTQRVAYLYEDYILYTNDENLEVYLNPTNPITVAYAQNDITAKRLNEAVRVAVVIGSTKIFYAPISETGAGNSVNAVTGFSNVRDATTVESFSMTNLAPYQAVTGAQPHTYEAGTTSLGTATPSGIHARVYIWLEGTDAQALLGMSDKDLKGLVVNVSFVGVADND